MPEKWEEVVLEGEKWPYEVSNFGEVRRTEPYNGTWRGRILRPQVSSATGYAHVRISRKNHPKTWAIHQLVMIAFVGQPPKGYSVHHKDGNRLNNRLDNLEYLPISENASLTSQRKISEEQVIEVRREMGKLEERYGLSPHTLAQISSGNLWGWLDG